MLIEVNWALNQLGVSVQEHDIVKGINEVRARAELPGYSAAEVNLHTIMSERAWELIFENKMLWDQTRTPHLPVHAVKASDPCAFYVLRSVPSLVHSFCCADSPQLSCIPPVPH